LNKKYLNDSWKNPETTKNTSANLRNINKTIRNFDKILKILKNKMNFSKKIGLNLYLNK
jgi:hypothetical protein